MTLHTKVLQRDITRAMCLKDRCYVALKNAQRELEANNIEKAAEWVEEFQKCKSEIDRLIEKKAIFEETAKNNLYNTVTKLQREGYKVDIVARK